MDVIAAPNDMQTLALAWRAAGRRVGVVPTMGCLHAGHLSLIRLARARADRVVVTLFVNPSQFGPAEDFQTYPRTFDADRRLCENEGVDALFAPSAAAMYAPDHSAWIEETRLSRHLCGASRPGHFRGVCTVVAKLFLLTQPHIAVFGEKDAQQLRIVRRMARDLNFPVEILGAPTARESDGLAVSSRNLRLSADERAQAVGLRRALDEAERRLADGERNADALKAAMREVLETVAPAARIDYIEIVDDETLEPVEHVERPALAAVAAWLGTTRLIDNTALRG